MMGRIDPLELLRSVNPVRDADVAGLASSEPAAALLRRIVSEPAPAPVPGPRRVRAGRRRLAPALVAAALCTGAVAYGVANRQASRPETVSCFAADDLQSATAVVVPVDRTPSAACADLWARGAFGAPAVPVLAECVLESGAVGVFPVGPAGDPCRALNLPPVAPAPVPSTSGIPATGPPPAPDDAAAFGAFEKAVLDRFVASPCVEPEQGRGIVREELARAGLKGWTVQDAAPFTAARPCATLAFNSPARQVLLVPSPRH